MRLTATAACIMAAATIAGCAGSAGHGSTEGPIVRTGSTIASGARNAAEGAVEFLIGEPRMFDGEAERRKRVPVPPTFHGDGADRLSPGDKRRAHYTAVSLASDGSAGDTAAWTNPVTSHSGKAHLIRQSDEVPRRECRRILLTAQAGGEAARKTVTACRLRGGAWRLR